MPPKAVVRGYTYAVVAVSWTNRRYGVSKMRLREMGSRYLFITLYVRLEAHLTRGDYRRMDTPPLADNEPREAVGSGNGHRVVAT
jgi:dolichol-phosphate mannosyltransferase